MDRFDPLRLAARELTGQKSLTRGPLVGRSNIEALIQNFQGIARKVEHGLEWEQMDFKGKVAAIAEQDPGWAPGLPLKVGTWVGGKYKK